jgi:hypothetical protein
MFNYFAPEIGSFRAGLTKLTNKWWSGPGFGRFGVLVLKREMPVAV